MTDSPLYTARSSCRICDGDLLPLLDLGSICLSDFLRPDQPDPPQVPLDLTICDACDLVQLRHTTNPERLYRQYWYLSGVNEVMRAELADVVRAAIEIVGGVEKVDTVIDVGANDGTLLANYESLRQPPIRVAFEPAVNLFNRVRRHCDVLYPHFFPDSSTHLQEKSVRILSSIACFYDLDDPRGFVAEVNRLLDDHGVWVVQFQDLAQMVQAQAYDNLCHEHLCYYSLKTFVHLLKGFDLHVVRIENRAINGGSLRIFVRRLRQPADPFLGAQVVYEEKVCNSLALERFAWQVGEHRTQLQGTVEYLLSHGQPLDMYGASTKANTLLQYCGFDHSVIQQAVERSPEKCGRVTGGTRIPIVSEEAWRMDPAPIALLAIWQFREVVLQREAAYLAGGGAFLVPLPSPEIIRGRS